MVKNVHWHQCADNAASISINALADALTGVIVNLARLSERLPAMAIDTLRDQWARIGKLDEEINTIEQRINVWRKQEEACRRIAEIPDVSPLTATAAIPVMGDPKAFKSGRECAAFVGLVPKQVGTGGKTKLLGISKRGGTYLRTMLIHGAKAVLTRATDPGPSAERYASGDHLMWLPWHWPIRWHERYGRCSPMTGNTKRIL
jgi:transposase